METTIGQRLKSAREALPASLYQAARQTKIRVDFLEHIERDNFRFLSGAAYVKGMVRAYAKWLGLDDEIIAVEFDRLTAQRPEPAIHKIIQEPAQRAPRAQAPKWVIAGGVAASALLVLSLIGVMNPINEVASPPAATESQQAAAGPSPSGAPPTVAQVPVVEGVHLTITITGPKSWLRVQADGKEPAIFEGTLFTGNTKTFDGVGELRVTIGDLGAVKVQLNGRDLGTPGPSGQVSTFVFTPESTAFARS
ncbi:MAG TPA: RodZ domain-containing protein [Actinomycetota bacterium]|nr:RodZ domain-containing protein [Actinomycetota bacterium]